MNSKSEFHQPGIVQVLAVRGNVNEEHEKGHESVVKAKFNCDECSFICNTKKVLKNTKVRSTIKNLQKSVLMTRIQIKKILKKLCAWCVKNVRKSSKATMTLTLTWKHTTKHQQCVLSSVKTVEWNSIRKKILKST